MKWNLATRARRQHARRRRDNGPWPLGAARARGVSKEKVGGNEHDDVEAARERALWARIRLAVVLRATEDVRHPARTGVPNDRGAVESIVESTRKARVLCAVAAQRRGLEDGAQVRGLALRKVLLLHLRRRRGHLERCRHGQAARRRARSRRRASRSRRLLSRQSPPLGSGRSRRGLAVVPRPRRHTMRPCAHAPKCPRCRCHPADHCGLSDCSKSCNGAPTGENFIREAPPRPAPPTAR